MTILPADEKTDIPASKPVIADSSDLALASDSLVDKKGQKPSSKRIVAGPGNT